MLVVMLEMMLLEMVARMILWADEEAPDFLPSMQC